MIYDSYKILTIENRPGLWYFLCAKFLDQYRYYGIIYNTEFDYCIISLVNANTKEIIDHFYEKKDYGPEEVFLQLCIRYDKFWHPELFDSQINTTLT